MSQKQCKKIRKLERRIAQLEKAIDSLAYSHNEARRISKEKEIKHQQEQKEIINQMQKTSERVQSLETKPKSFLEKLKEKI